MVDIAKLTVRLEAENSKLSRALDKSKRDVRRFETQARRSAKAARSALGGIFAGLTFGSLVIGTRTTLEFADSIDKASKVAGLAAEELQELRFAGEQVGITTKEVDEGFRRFNRRLGEFLSSGAGPAAKALDLLGITIDDVKGKTTGEIFDDVVKGMADVETQAQRSALQAQLFGDDAGPKLDLLLREGASGIRNLRQEAQDIGAVLDDSVIANAVVAKDSLDKLSSVIKVQLTQAFVNLAPVLTSTANAFVDLSRIANKAFGNIGSISDADVVEERISELLVKIESANSRLARSQKAQTGRSATDFFVRIGGLASPEDLQKEVDKYEAELKSAYAQLSKIQADLAEENEQIVFNPPVPQAPPGTSASVSADIKETPELLDSHIRAFKALNVEAENLRKSLRTPFEVASDSMERYDILLENNLITVDTWGRAVNDALDGIAEETEEATEKMSVFAEEAARQMQRSFSEFLFDPFEEDGLKGMLDGFVTTLRQMAAQAASASIFEAIGGLEGQGGFIGAIGSFFGGAVSRASGGRLAAGQLAVVNEREPELFIPDVSGDIIPLSQAQGVGGITVNVTMPQGGGNQQSASQFGFEVAQALRIASGRNG